MPQLKLVIKIYASHSHTNFRIKFTLQFLINQYLKTKKKKKIMGNTLDKPTTKTQKAGRDQFIIVKPKLTQHYCNL